MAKKQTKRTSKPRKAASKAGAPAPASKPAEPKQTRKAAEDPKATKPRAEREAVLDLRPAEDVAPVRAGTHLADVLALTARPEGATALELDAAIVTTARSVRHYGIWALRYPLHRNKGYGFETIRKSGAPARYRLVLPEGHDLASLLTPVGSKKAVEPPAEAPAPKRSKRPAAGKRDARASARA